MRLRLRKLHRFAGLVMAIAAWPASACSAADGQRDGSNGEVAGAGGGAGQASGGSGAVGAVGGTGGGGAGSAGGGAVGGAGAGAIGGAGGSGGSEAGTGGTSGSPGGAGAAGTAGTSGSAGTGSTPPCDAPPEPTFAGTKQVSDTIVIDTPGVHDFGNVLHEWNGSGSCNQTENQPYVLRIAASNVTLKNFAYRNAPDGIHIGTANDGQGYDSGQKLTNIVLENVTGWACEDALTVQYGVEDVLIRDSHFFANPTEQYRDKLLQLNFGDVTVERTTFSGGNGGTCLMFKGSQNIHVVDSCFWECARAVNGSTQNGIVGKIGTGHSELLSERNVGRNPTQAPTFWDPWLFLTADGDVHMQSVADQRLDNGIDKANEGASIDYQ